MRKVILLVLLSVLSTVSFAMQNSTKTVYTADGDRQVCTTECTDQGDSYIETCR